MVIEKQEPRLPANKILEDIASYAANPQNGRSVWRKKGWTGPFRGDIVQEGAHYVYHFEHGPVMCDKNRQLKP